MEAAGLWRAVLVGHAMGGAIALSLALETPARVAGIGLISSGARLPVSSAVLENVANPSTFNLAVQQIHELSFGSQATLALKEQVFAHLCGIRTALLQGDLLASDRFDVTARLDTIRAPVLVMCGTDDKLTPPRYSETLARQIPGAALQTIDCAGHMVMLEQPRRVAGLLNIFMKTIPYSPGR
jgi:pimeloyl-ACP methyl ester carboxylesterase